MAGQGSKLWLLGFQALYDSSPKAERPVGAGFVGLNQRSKVGLRILCGRMLDMHMYGWSSGCGLERRMLEAECLFCL